MYETRTIEVGGISTRYVECGAGEPLVLVHGGQISSLYSLDSWGLNLAGFARRFHVYAFDKLGQGHTDAPKSDADYTIEATVQHAYDFLRAVGVDRAYLVGHSRGAYLITRLAMEHPELARALIIVDSNSILAGGTPTPFYDQLRAIAPPWGTREAVILEPTANAFSGRHITEDFVSGMMAIAALPKSAATLAKFEALSATQFFPPFKKQREETIAWIENGGVKIPVLLVWGFNDPSAPLDSYGLDTLRLFAQHVPRTQMHVFNEAGHYVFREHPDEFVAVVTRFIEAMCAPAGTAAIPDAGARPALTRDELARHPGTG